MRYILPEELPPEAGRAIGRALSEGGESTPAWVVLRVWENGQAPAGYAVTLEQAGKQKAFTVMPREGGFEAFDVTRV